jgi:hypothetical protein
MPLAVSSFTLVHVVISLIGIFTGFVVVFGMVAGKQSRGWTATFLATTLATSVTGFFFPIHGFTPALGVGIISVVILACSYFALYGRRLSGAWRWIYVLTAVLAQYFNFFVLIAQSFQKIPALHALAPTQKEPPFAIAQGAALLLFVVLGLQAVRKFHPTPASAAPAASLPRT